MLFSFVSFSAFKALMRLRAHLGVSAAALVGLIFSAKAADLGVPALKDPIPGSLNWKGVTIYGTIDAGYAYQRHGVPFNGAFYTGLEYNLNGSKNAGRAISSLTEGGLEQSKIGVKVEEAVGFGFLAIGKLEAAFNPLSGEIADACASMVRNNGKLYSAQTANSDGSRCGQAFSGPAFGGISSPIYGTVTFGRQQSLELDAIGSYDPMGLPYAFSLLGYSGGTAAGSGSTETSRWDNAMKYAFSYGPAHAAAMYTAGGPDTAIFNGAYGFNAGGTWQGFSIDAVYTKERGTVVSSLIPNPAYTTGISCIPGNCPHGLLGTISDNEAWSVMAKYAYEFENGFKDDGPGAKLTVSAGYVHIDMSNPEDADIVGGATTIGGVSLSASRPTPIPRTRFCKHSGAARSINCRPAGVSLRPTTDTARTHTSTARGKIVRLPARPSLAIPPLRTAQASSIKDLS